MPDLTAALARIEKGAIGLDAPIVPALLALVRAHMGVDATECAVQKALSRCMDYRDQDAYLELTIHAQAAADALAAAERALCEAVGGRE